MIFRILRIKNNINLLKYIDNSSFKKINYLNKNRKKINNLMIKNYYK